MSILIIVDPAADAGAVLAELRRAGYEPNCHYAATEADFRAALGSDPDLVLADSGATPFGVLDALRLLREQDRDVPLVVVLADGLNDQAVAHYLQQGAADCLYRGQLARLGQAIGRALAIKRLGHENEGLRKALEEMAQESEQKYRSLVEKSGDGIALIDEEGTVIEWNDSQERITGLPRAQVLGQPLWDVQLRMAVEEERTPDMCARRKEGVLQFLHSGRSPYTNRLQEIPIQRPDGEQRCMQITISPIRTAKGFMVSTISRDVTERRGIERALQQAKEAAEQANRAKSEFLAHMSHEIRTPLHNIIGLTELIHDTERPEEQREYLDMIASSSNLLLALANDILDYADIEAGRLGLEEADLDLRTVTEQAVDAVALQAHRKGLEAVVSIPPGVPTALIGDAKRLHQVLVNLASNAVKFTERGEIVIGVQMEADEGEKVALHFSIRDTGIGIAAEEQAAVFEAFRQSDGSSTRRYGGIGLGLAIARRLVALMGGRIWVESTLGVGSTFHFVAYLRKRPGSVGTTPPAKAEATFQGLPALVIDDNTSSRLVLRQMLSAQGFAVTEAAAAPAGLQEIDRASGEGRPFRLILLDSVMPRMDGFTAAAWFRDDPATRNNVIMMLSAEQVHDALARCRELGIATQIIKPIKQGELCKAIAQILKPAPAAAVAVVEPAPLQARERGLCILLAEDNLSVQLIGKRTLEKLGYQVQVASNGREVLDRLGEGEFDLILMDVEMPVMDGYEATRLIRRQEAASGGHVPILATTAYATKTDQDKCTEAGMDGHLFKPYNREQLANALKPFLAPAPEEPGAASRTELEAALQAFGGQAQDMREVIGMFLAEDYPRHLAAAQEGIAHRDARSVRSAAHGLQGALGSFGGKRACQVARRLEDVAREGNLSGAPSLLRELQHEVERFVALLEPPWSEQGRIMPGQSGR